MQTSYSPTKRNKTRLAALGAVFALTLGLMPAAVLAQLQPPGSGAPTSGGLFGSSPDLLIGNASKALQEYCKNNNHLPKSSGEIDAALKAVVAKLTGSDPSTAQITSDKDFRVLGSVVMSIDPSFKDTTVEQLRKSPPANFKAPPGHLVIFIAGEEQFIIWYAAGDGKPAVDALGQPIILRQECSQ